jgi:hypothetical protein
LPVGDGFRGEEISFVTFRHYYLSLSFFSFLFVLGGFSLSLSSLSAFIYDDVLLMGELVFVLFPNVFSDEEKKKSSNSHVT